MEENGERNVWKVSQDWDQIFVWLNEEQVVLKNQKPPVGRPLYLAWEPNGPLHG
jgi:hypothetical protein